MNPNTVTVRVPATSANLGPGFDSLGLALAITQDVTLSLNYDAAQDGGGLARLVVEAARSAYRLAHVPVPDELKATAKTAPTPESRLRATHILAARGQSNNSP